MLSHSAGMANDPDVSRDRGPAIRQMSLRFDDGSIVLRVERTLLRVHRTILCTYSEIFANMFNIPQVKGEATVEGCTIVYPPDKATDFVDLLQPCFTFANAV
jgi:hypothetical protein